MHIECTKTFYVAPGFNKVSTSFSIILNYLTFCKIRIINLCLYVISENSLFVNHIKIMNKQVCEMLYEILVQESTSWDYHLINVWFVFNGSKNKSTMYSHFSYKRVSVTPLTKKIQSILKQSCSVLLNARNMQKIWKGWNTPKNMKIWKEKISIALHPSCFCCLLYSVIVFYVCKLMSGSMRIIENSV